MVDPKIPIFFVWYCGAKILTIGRNYHVLIIWHIWSLIIMLNVFSISGWLEFLVLWTYHKPSVFLSFFGSFAQVRRECDMQIREAEHRHRAELAAEQERVREAHEMVELIQSVVPSLIQFVCFFSCRVSCGCFLKGWDPFWILLADVWQICIYSVYIPSIIYIVIIKV